ncbi:uncharacterized protein [Watersipora subatra]|uniref:uncharacterized protein n=1 Tax=Watersipora subatra TaxID=2589382 RepID=UPI00355B988C
MAEVYQGVENRGYGVSPGSNSEPGHEIADQHVGTKGMLHEKVKHSMKIHAIIQLIIGALCIIFQTIVLIWALHIYDCFLDSFFFFFSAEAIPSDGAGVWCGAMFCITGVVGLLATNKGTRNWVMAYMVCSILSAMLVFVVIGLAFLNITDVDSLFCSSNPTPLAFDGLMIAAAAIELIVSIWSVVLSCDARYGCCKTPEREEYYNVMFDQRASSANLERTYPTPNVPQTSAEQLPTYSEVNLQHAEKY